MTRAAIIRCPRCGYELQGVVASWSDACPLAGRCTECGLAFEWAEIVSPSRLPAWCVEYARRWWNVPVGSLKTLLMMLRPWRFWSELRMTHAPRWGRVIAMFAAFVLLSYAGFAATVGVLVVRDARRSSPPTATVAYSAAYAILLPLSTDPAGPYLLGLEPPIDYAAQFRLHIGPMTDLRFAILTRGSPVRWGYRPTLGSVFVTALLASTTVLAAPLGFMALPASRRRAKVLWWHVHRITLYSLVISAVACVGAFVYYTVGLFRGELWEMMIARVWQAVLVGVPIPLIIWWQFAVNRYLRMPHAIGVAVALVIIGLLLGPAIVVLILNAVLF